MTSAMKLKNIFLLAVMAYACTVLQGQVQLPSLLSLEEALAIGVENNYQIKIIRQSEKIANANYHKGNAGYYPIIAVGADQNNVLSNTDLTFLSGDELSVRGAVATTFGANVALRWNLFDGNLKSTTFRKLGNEVQLSKAYTRAEAEILMAEIIKAYIALALQNKLLDFTRENIEISRARLQLAIDKQRIGSGSGASVLQSRLDFNNDSLILVNQKLQVDVLRFQLLDFLQIDTREAFSVDTSNVQLLTKNYDALREDVLSQNTDLLIARFAIGNAQEDVASAKSLQYPGLFLNSGANFNWSRNPANFVIQNVNYGPYLGLSANYILYDGNNIKRNIEVAKLQTETRKLEYENAMLKNVIQLNNLISQHESFKIQRLILEDNIQISKENLDIAIEQYRLGALTDVEFREIQLKSIQSNFELVQNQLQRNILEADILRLTGNLITD